MMISSILVLVAAAGLLVAFPRDLSRGLLSRVEQTLREHGKLVAMQSGN